MSARPAVLVCDDEPQIVRALKIVLREAGFEALPAEHACRRRSTSRALQRPDAAIVDLVLPDGDGVEVCRALREWSEMPILVLSAVGDEDAEGPRAGGRRRRLRDQAVQPARAGRAPAGGRCAAPAPEADEPVIRADGLEIDLAARIVRRDGEEVHLTPIEFDLLRVLAAQPRPPADAPRAAAGGLGPRLRRRRRHAAHQHRPPAAQDRARPRAARATSAPTRASATASTPERAVMTSVMPGRRIVMPPSRPRTESDPAWTFSRFCIALAAFALLHALIEGLDRV